MQVKILVDSSNLGTRIKLARKGKKLTQGELADRIGLCGPSAVNQLETEKIKTIDLPMLRRVDDVLESCFAEEVVNYAAQVAKQVL
ncbi:MAG: helix-turn-helix transcriptional regulator [Leptolyngbyaceae cyanobacterium CSU_1_4]|nr:helix-turn-helix transcriptional regulator [Leptolyngbyaceae cyanobacterium CSU_1_4]